MRFEINIKRGQQNQELILIVRIQLNINIMKISIGKPPLP